MRRLRPMFLLPALTSVLVASAVLLTPAGAAAASDGPRPAPKGVVSATAPRQLAAAPAPTEPSTTVPLDESQVPVQRMIPLPNSGHKPVDPGDPGGSLQVGLFFVMLAGMVLIAGLIVLDSRRKKKRLAAGSHAGRVAPAGPAAPAGSAPPPQHAGPIA